jgi:hypothetical protein
MAISPNTDFSSGQILTATNANQWPRGIMALTTATSNSATFTTSEIVTITGSSFTAVANRYYEITYYEPVIGTNSGTVNRISLGIRLTNISGAVQVSSNTESGPDQSQLGLASVVKTLTAGTVNFVATAVVLSGAGTAICTRSATSAAYLMVKDLGPA